MMKHWILFLVLLAGCHPQSQTVYPSNGGQTSEAKGSTDSGMTPAGHRPVSPPSVGIAVQDVVPRSTKIKELYGEYQTYMKNFEMIISNENATSKALTYAWSATEAGLSR
jgi:hypothetical protein